MNIILQHFNGELRELDKLSVENIKKYAERINVDYQLVTGKPFSKNLTNPCQKVHCISHEWDDYDEVLMLDPDMFVAKDLTTNVFDNLGNGTHHTWQIRLKERLCRARVIKESTPYWAGSFYKFNREERKRLRDKIGIFDEWKEFNRAYTYEDEGILSVLAMRANLAENYIDVKWNYDSYLHDIDKAKMIHIRTKKPGHLNGSWDNGGKVDKIINYNRLVDTGII